MSVFEELLKKHCPDGVEYKTLSEIGEFSNIGVDKKKVDGEKEILLLNFIDVMKNMYIDKSIPKMVVTASDYKIEKCTIEEGDIFITPSSETIDEIGFASVITETIPNACYSYHIMRFRLFEYNMTTSIFIRYCFDSSFLRKQIRKSAQGITRFGLTLNKWKSLKIPFPPIEVQKEIVRILDEFTEKTNKLQELLHRETILRKKQYEYYRNYLFNKIQSYNNVLLGDIADISVGSKPEFISDNKTEFEYINAGTTNSGYTNNYNCLGDTVTTPSRGQGGIGYIGYQKNNFWLGALCYQIRSNKDYILTKYIYYYLKNNNELILKIKNSGGLPSVNRNDLIKINIKFPSLEYQKEIIDILDQFDTLCNDITRGLPAEIELRKKQYEYYRDKLLTFKEKKK
ncbi:restriction endonuclease subunit S [Brachyspira pilosicoli]|uniref:restriction endonuclease subunit S n=1 Tax=Brachyspira pilosicoli TaxID=52584 RepID=UPI0012F5239D|nr:restriction endonuclease subunit S [Brachyspira pilosicoli]